jgi:hypothetical protein
MKMPDTPDDELTGTILISILPAQGEDPCGSKLFPGTGLCHFFRGFNRSGRICMGRQLVTMGMGVGGMAEGEGWFRDGLMFFMREGIFRRVMTGIFQVTFTVLAGPGFHSSFFLTVLF